MHLETAALASNQIEFPVLVIQRNKFYFFTDWDHFTTGHRSALVRSAYTDQFLLDSMGFGMTIVQAKKVHGIGFFKGWNLLGNQKIRLEYQLADDRRKYCLDEIKNLIIGCLEKWRDLDDFKILEQNIRNATSINHIMKYMMHNPWTNAVNSKWY